MLNLICYLGLIRPWDLPHFPLLLDGLSITDYFARGSSDAFGAPRINLVVDQYSRLNSSILPANAATNTIWLQNSLSKLTQNPLNNHFIQNIGLLFADRYAGHEGVYGYMFDAGFDPQGEPDVNPAFHVLPREGCVVFLDKIRENRDNSDFANEVMYTAIHELGHVFNLWHVENTLNFMRTSQANNQAYPPDAYFFLDQHRHRLHNALDPYVRPGCRPFTVWGPGGPAANNPYKDVKIEKELDLKIHIQQEEFWFFEPIEMDIELSTSIKDKVFEVPDELDPGYERFIIYIARPDGTVTKYKPTKFFCSNTGMLKISSEQCYQRDISIFGQSGGYTFNSGGIYTIECFFKFEDRWLKSNTIDVEVKLPMFNSTAYNKTKRLLADPQAAKLLYYRSGSYSKHIIEELTIQSKKKRAGHLPANLSYALARYGSQNKEIEDKNKKKMLTFAKQAFDSGKLSTNRINNLQKLQERLE